MVVKAQSTAVDKVQHRLEQLDSFEEGSQRKLDLSQTEYISTIEQLNKCVFFSLNHSQVHKFILGNLYQLGTLSKE